MSAVNVVSKVLVCGLAAMALTVASSMSFVESTAKAYYAEDMPTVIVMAKRSEVQLAQSGSAGLLQ